MGDVNISGAKNAAVAILPGVVLAEGPCIIENVPAISDIATTVAILQSMGATVTPITKNTLQIDPTTINCTDVPHELTKYMQMCIRDRCIPKVDEAFCLKALKQLVEIERDWVPHIPDASLYIRPFIIATEGKLGVHASNSYYYVVVLSPSGPYYAAGLDPIKIYVEKSYVRAVRGGMGFAKTGGNYAASLKAQEEASEQKYAQVLWLDGVERRYIEEVGAMNIFFVIGDEVVTPALQGSILSGITRKSALELMAGWGLKVSERRLAIDEVAEAYDKGLRCV